jgi:ribonuclease G
LPFQLFRRRKPDREQAPAQAAAPPQPQERSEPPAARAAVTETDPNKAKRRRGTRGGRNRKKTGTASSTQTRDGAETKEAPRERKPREPREAREPREKEPVRSQAEERRLQQRKERSSGGQQRRRREPPRRAPLPAAKRELLVSVDVGEQRVAVLEDGQVAEVYLERPERRSIAGNIYLGSVDNVLPGMEAAFVEIGLEKNGFLYVDEIVRPELEGSRHGKRIQDLLSRGEQVLVQAVKDPMKSKGARLTMEISLPGRFVVFVPNGEGLGVSRRLEDDERQRLKDIVKKLDVKKGGVIVRTAAEGASAEDIERDFVFLQKLWKTIETEANKTKAPALVYQEAELPLRVTRDLFTHDFVHAYVDDDKAYKRIVGYLKKTSPHMVERVTRYKDKPALLEAYGVEAEIRSTLSRRVDLPSGGYLIFDYAEAFTVIDVNTGRFVGSRSKTSGARLEDTITKNNLEAVKEVVRQLRLRDIGGIIVIDFIDMANPKNRQAVEDALRTELERDRTKTYVVEISPLGLVEMTRQNVTEGPREILTRKCPTCGGDGVVISEQTAAIDMERRLRELARGSRVQAFKVEVNAKIASTLIGPGGARLEEIEAAARRRFFLVPKENAHLDHFLVMEQGKLETIAPKAPVEEGATMELQLVEVGLHESSSAVAKVDGFDVCVAGAAKLVGKKVKVQIVRVLPNGAYGTIVSSAKAARAPITAEGEAEKPTRKPVTAKKDSLELEAGDELDEGTELEDEDADDELEEREELEEGEVEGVEAEDAETPTAADGSTPAKRKTRRGSRGGRRRKKPAAAGAEPISTSTEIAIRVPTNGDEPTPAPAPARPSTPKIYVPPSDFGRDGDSRKPEPVPATITPVADAVGESEVEPSENGANADGAATPVKKKTRRGSRGGKNRRKKPAGAPTTDSTPPEPGESS